MCNKKQLFCFTYAGGNASFFDKISEDLSDIEVIAFEYAGHGKRHKESLYQDFDALADDLFSNFKELYSGGEYSLFGYSMGTISLVEVLKRIITRDISKMPSNIFLAAHEPHTKSELAGFTDDELDDWVKDRTIKFGAIPEKLVSNKSFWRMYLPLYRADYSIIGKYQFECLNLTTDIPTSLFYSESDTPLKEIKLWEQFFVGNCDYYEFTGNHFFIQEHHRAIAEIIQRKMEM